MTDDEKVNSLVDAPDGSILTSWIIVAQYADPNSATTVCSSTSDTMNPVTQLGLAEAARDFARRRYHGVPSDE